MIKNWFMAAAGLFYLAAALQYFLTGRILLGLMTMCYFFANLIISFLG